MDLWCSNLKQWVVPSVYRVFMALCLKTSVSA